MASYKHWGQKYDRHVPYTQCGFRCCWSSSKDPVCLLTTLKEPHELLRLFNDDASQAWCFWWVTNERVIESFQKPILALCNEVQYMCPSCHHAYLVARKMVCEQVNKSRYFSCWNGIVTSGMLDGNPSISPVCNISPQFEWWYCLLGPTWNCTSKINHVSLGVILSPSMQFWSSCTKFHCNRQASWFCYTDNALDPIKSCKLYYQQEGY